jgi:hypothetical protein
VECEILEIHGQCRCRYPVVDAIAEDYVSGKELLSFLKLTSLEKADGDYR